MAQLSTWIHQKSNLAGHELTGWKSSRGNSGTELAQPHRSEHVLSEWIRDCRESEEKTHLEKHKIKIQWTEAHSLPSSLKKLYPLLSASYLKQKNNIPVSSDLTICHSDSDCDSCTYRTAASLALTCAWVTAQRRAPSPSSSNANSTRLYTIKVLHMGYLQQFSGVNNYTRTKVWHHQERWLLYLQQAVQPTPDWARLQKMREIKLKFHEYNYLKSHHL